jgi:serine/threonine protein kinase
MAEKGAILDDADLTAGRPDAPVAAAPAVRPKNDAMRFIYATGARPLEGYTIKRGIGIGGFGQVYYAVSDAGKEVALKHIQRNLDVELRGVSQCLNLKHPNLLALYDIRYDEAGEGWVVMEYITGESLRDVIERNPNGMPADDIAYWLAGISAGCACLHDHGIVHRDLKPGNVFDDNGIVKVGDYGLSKFISVSRRSAQTESVGTFHYMAPEIGRGRYGREIDVYALGVMLYEMLTGDVPFDGESSQEIIMKHLTSTAMLDHVPEPYRGAIAGALEKDPEKRISSIPEMLARLNMRVPTAGARPVIAIAPVTPPVRVPQTSAHSANGNVQPATDLVIDEDETNDPLIIGDQRREEISLGPVENHFPSVPGLVPMSRMPLNRATVTQTMNPVAALPTQRSPVTSLAPAPPPQEPIARAVVGGWNGFVGWFSSPRVSSVLKILVVAITIVAALYSVRWLVPVALGLMIVYGLYYAVRALIITLRSDAQTKQQKSPAEATLADRLQGRRKWQQLARDQRAVRPLAQKMAEVTGSLLVSAIIAAILSVCIMIFAGHSLQGSLYQWGPQLAWLAICGIAASWAVLIPAKLWEAREGDQIMRRITMLAIGLGLGALAFGIDAALLVDIAYHETNRPPEQWSHLVDANRQPTIVNYLLYFGGLFVILRWWLQGDPLRSSRLNLWSIILSGLWGLVIPFPQPWGVLLAIAISISVQLAAPWVSTEDRTRLRQRYRIPDAHAPS